jgi:hypothetical protein
LQSPYYSKSQITQYILINHLPVADTLMFSLSCLCHLNIFAYVFLPSVYLGNKGLTYYNLLNCSYGTLKGYDQLLNLVIDEAVEFLTGKYDIVDSTITLFLHLVIQ